MQIGERVCRKCGLTKLDADFSPPELKRNYPRCRVCVNAYVKQHYATNEAYRERRKAAARKQVKTFEYARKHSLKHKYGITPEQYQEMLASQGGGCALCGSKEVGNSRWNGFFQIDHDHASDVVRGLLCQPCNTRLGSFEVLIDRLGMEKILAYLKRGRPDA